MTVKAVFFDMGGTIDTFWYSPEMRLQATPGLQQLLSRAGINLHLTDEQLYELVISGLDHYHQWRLKTFEELPPKQLWCQYILAGYPDNFYQLDSIAEDLMVWIETRYYQRKMRPEIPSVLEALRNMGVKIGLISNVNSRGQVPLNLDQYGIRHYFDPIVLSSEYGRRKPDPAIFHYAARLAHSPTSECIYIGDRISRDIVGAKRAGFHLAIQIRHDFDHGEKDEGAEPDMVINRMTGLLEILRKETIQQSDQIKADGTASKQIRAFIFDMDGVLYFREQRGERITAFLNELGLNGDNISLPQVEALRQQAFTGLMNFDQYHEAILRLHGVTEPELIDRGLQIIREENRTIQYFNGCREVLRTLKENKYYLGIITDTVLPLHVKLKRLEDGGFGDVWDSIISSREVGFHKPDPRIYQEALNQLGITSGQAVFVGHKTSELDGARAVGMVTVAFNYDETADADFYIEKFSDLLELPLMVPQQ